MKYLYLAAADTTPDPALSPLDTTEGYPCFCVYVYKPQGSPAYASASLGHKSPRSFTSIFDTTPRPGVRVLLQGAATLKRKREALTAVIDWLDTNHYVTPEALATARAAVAQATEIEA